MVKEDGVGRSAIVVGYTGRLQCDGSEEFFLVGKANQLQPLFDGSFDATAVGPNVSQQLSEFTRLKDEFAECFVADCSL